MRYNELMELAGVKRFHDMTSTEVVQYFKRLTGDQMVSILGNGKAGVAVLIGQTVYKFWQVDSAYQAFVEFCMGKHNPFLPAFQSQIKTMPAFFMRSPDAPDTVNYVKMERLTPNDDIMATQYSIGNTQVSLNDITSLMHNVDSWLRGPKKEFVRQLSILHKTKIQESDLTGDLNILVDTLLAIRKIGFKLDLHAGNFMMRGSQVVIVDPLLDPKGLLVNTALRAFDQAIRLDDTPELAKPAVGSIKESHDLVLGDTQIAFTLSPSSQRHQDVLVDVLVQPFDAAWQNDRDFYIGKGGTGGIGKRYQGFGNFLASTDGEIEASEVYVNDRGEVSFNNGRHRFAYLRDQGATTIPVAMSPDAIKNAKKFGYLT